MSTPEQLTPRYYRVSPQFWTDPKVSRWTPDAKFLAFYILTCEHRTTEGLFVLKRGYVMADLEWSKQRFTEGLAELTDDGFIQYDENAQVCLIVNALKYQSPQNPNQVTSALRKLAEVPNTPLTCTFKGLAKRFNERLFKALPKGFGESQAPALTPPPSQTPPPEKQPLAAKTPRKSDHIFDAVSAACGINPEELTDSGRGPMNKAVKDIKKVTDDYSEVHRRARNYRKTYPDTALTPTALAKHWAQLDHAQERAGPKDRFAEMAQKFVGEEVHNGRPASPQGADASRRSLPER